MNVLFQGSVESFSDQVDCRHCRARLVVNETDLHARRRPESSGGTYRIRTWYVPFFYVRCPTKDCGQDIEVPRDRIPGAVRERVLAPHQAGWLKADQVRRAKAKAERERANASALKWVLVLLGGLALISVLVPR